MLEFLSIIAIIFGVLQIILFFKIWGMTNDVRELRDHLIEGDKPKLVKDIPNRRTNVVEETHEYDKRLDTLGVGDHVLLKSTGQKVEIVKTWGKDFIVSTPKGNVSVGKHEISLD